LPINVGGTKAFGCIFLLLFFAPHGAPKSSQACVESIGDLSAYKLEKPTAAVDNRQSAAFAGQDGEDDEALTA